MDLERINAELWKVSIVRQMRLSLAPDPYLPDPEFSYDLEIELFDTDTRNNVHLVFRTIGALRLQQENLRVIQLFLMVEPNDPGHEQRYRVWDVEADRVVFTCRKVELLTPGDGSPPDQA